MYYKEILACCVNLTETGHIIALLLVLIASIVLVCKSLWIKASAKLINLKIVNYIF